jgi:hypothetical protein
MVRTYGTRSLAAILELSAEREGKGAMNRGDGE